MACKGYFDGIFMVVACIGGESGFIMGGCANGLAFAANPSMIHAGKSICFDDFALKVFLIYRDYHQMDSRTPLYEEHAAAGAKICSFAGYAMPLQYKEGVLEEHNWVRAQAGLFDVSHMGQAVVRGREVAAWLSHLTPSLITALTHGQARYTVLTNEQGGIIDDLIITRMEEDAFFLVFNAARREPDLAWLRGHLREGLTFEELPGQALLALQGPRAEEALVAALGDEGPASLSYMHWGACRWNGTPLWISRLGYTGEDGFEISLPGEKAAELWRLLLAQEAVRPVGLAARDSLRLEMGYPLYGQDLTEEITPVEASLSWVIGKKNTGFIGEEPVRRQQTQGCQRKRVGIRLSEKGVARAGAAVYIGEKQIGALTSGGFSPSLECGIGQGYLEAAFAQEGEAVELAVRGRRIGAVVAPLSQWPARTKTPKASTAPAAS